MEQVRDLEQLARLAEERRSVFAVTRVGYADGVVTERPSPAAWVLNQSGNRLLYLFKHGLYVYEAKRRGSSAKETKDTKVEQLQT